MSTLGLAESQARRPKVALVLLNWNNYADTGECLLSLRCMTYPNFHVIVVDNGSTDGSAQQLKTEFPECEFVANAENLGFAKGCNIGIRRALEKGADYVAILDNDIVVESNFLDVAVEFAERDSGIGLIGGKLYDYNEPSRIWSVCGEISWLRGRGVGFAHRALDRGQFDRPKEVGFVRGGFMLARKHVFHGVGLFPEEYFFGGEEWDFSVAVRRHGYSLWYLPDFKAWHKGSRSHRRFDPGYVYSAYSNKLMFQRKYLSPLAWRAWFAAFRLYRKLFLKSNLVREARKAGERPNLPEILAVIDRAIAEAASVHK